MITRASYLYKLIRFSRQECVARISIAAHHLRRARSSSALSGGNSTGRFFQDSARAWACAPDKIDIVARREFFRLSQETVRIHRVENQLPLDVFLARQDKWDRFVVRVNQQQKCVIADWFPFKIENIDRVAAQQHANAANKRRRPFLLAHFAPARIEPHYIPNLRTAYPPALKKFWPTKHRMRLAKPNQLSREL